jgi:fluoride exporter
MPSGRSRPDRPANRWFQHHDEALPVDPDLAPDDPAEPSATPRSGAHLRRSRRLDVLAAIFAGGMLGALSRYEVGLAWPTAIGHFPWATFAINTSGALLLGVVLTVLLEHPGRWRYARPVVCVGFLGAWTTMSTFALEADLLVKHGRPATALLYGTATVVVGLVSTGLGIATARHLHARRTAWLSR